MRTMLETGDILCYTSNTLVIYHIIIFDLDCFCGRPSVRRQSARLTAVRPKQADDLFEMEEAKSPKCMLPVPDNDSTVENEDHAVQR